MSSESLDPVPRMDAHFYHCGQQFSCQNGYSYDFISTMIFFKEFYEYELVIHYGIHIANQQPLLS